MTRFKIIAVLATAVCLGAALFAAAGASAAGVFGIQPGTFKSQTYAPKVDLDEPLREYTQAGGHPGHFITEFKLNQQPAPGGEAGTVPAGANLRLGEVALPAGMMGNPTVLPECLPFEFFKAPFNSCSDDAQIGIAKFDVHLGGNFKASAPIFNLQAGPEQPATFGLWVITVPVVLVPVLRSDGDYGLTVMAKNVDETLPVNEIELDFWGTPASPEHDNERGQGFWGGCSSVGASPPCISHARQEAFFTTSMDCSAGPAVTTIHAESWAGETDDASYVSQDESGNPSPRTGCDKIPFAPTASAQPSVGSAESPSGFKFELRVPDAGLRNPTGLAQAEIKKAEVQLPQGMSINPSAGEGLGHCTPADFAREKLNTAPGEGCPNSSKLGSVQIDTPLLEERATGSLYLAQTDDPATTTPGAENPFDTLVSMYMVARIPDRGIFVKAAGKVVPDPVTGQITTTFDDLPQLPINSFTLNFREGARSPLVTPPTCGTFAIKAILTPWSAADPDNPAPGDTTTLESPFQITSGVGGGPCPSGGTPPFKPGLIAGSINNAAGKYSPFNVRLFRNDGEQEFTRFAIKLPPGILGKLAGIPYCADSAVEAARFRTAGQELASPSCPASSEIGSTLVGSGVGSILTYVPGKVYLAGPYNGSQLSIAAITAAKVGPFDVGTVVIRQALKVDPDTAEVFIDSVGSDPIPHIVKGIKVHARDIRVYIDRPNFILNPTNCERTSTASTVLGSGVDFVSLLDDNPVTVTSPFQAADCGALPFKPKLALSVSGATKRAGNPKFKAVLTMNPGEANIARAQVTLPRTEFLDNAHIGTVCTRVQFRAKECPAESIYGKARAFTPILDGPIEGPVYLRSNPEHNLPDLVAALHGQQIEVDLAGRVDSVGKGRIRNTFEAVPDAPVSKFVLEMDGGDKGLLENSANLCAKPQRAIARFVGQNGKKRQYFPVLKAKCGKKAKKKKGKRNN